MTPERALILGDRGLLIAEAARIMREAVKRSRSDERATYRDIGALERLQKFWDHEL